MWHAPGVQAGATGATDAAGVQDCIVLQGSVGLRWQCGRDVGGTRAIPQVLVLVLGAQFSLAEARLLLGPTSGVPTEALLS